MSDESDTRVVNLRINNKDFLKGAADSAKALDGLNKNIDGAGKTSGMKNLGKDVTEVSTKFGALQIAGVTAVANIANRAVNAGITLAKSMTVGPLIDGFREYEKLLTSTQTIAANTNNNNAEGLKIVGAALDELNRYSDETIYNFGQMADNIGRFTAAGVDLDVAVTSIKGLANAAALFGSDANQLNTAMYQMSQALATGTIRLMDWNSLANAGMGGENMQYALMESAKTVDDFGVSMQQSLDKYGNFRDSLTGEWLTSNVFNKAMTVMAGTTEHATKSVKELTEMGFKPAQIETIKAGKTIAYTVEQLKAMGYSQEAAETLNTLSQNAIDSATKIKTFTQLIDVVKESIGSGWAMIFRSLFGNLEESIAMWTAVGNAITNVIGRGFMGLNAILTEWRRLGGYEKLWAGIGNIFKSIGNLLRPFVMLLGAIFPGTETAGKGLYGVTEAFYQFTVWLEKATSATGLLNPVIDGLAWVFGVLGAVVKGVFQYFWGYTDLIFPIIESFVGMGVAVGNLVQRFVEFYDLKDRITGFFDGFIEARAQVFEPLVAAVELLEAAFKDLLTGDFDGFRANLASIPDALSVFGDWAKQGWSVAQDLMRGLVNGIKDGSFKDALFSMVTDAINFFKDLLGIHSPSTVFKEFGLNIVQGLADGLLGAVSLLGKAVKWLGDYLKNMDFQDFANVISLVFGGAVFMQVRNFMTGMSSMMSAFGGASEQLFGKKGLFDEMTNTVKRMQTVLIAGSILAIALAMLALAVSIRLLSGIPMGDLAKGLGAVTVMMGGLVLIMKMLSDMGNNDKATKLGMANMLATAITMGIMAAAVLLLAGAVLAFGSMPLDVLAKGLGAVTVVMLGMAALGSVIGKVGGQLALAGAAMVLGATALLILAGALTAVYGVMQLYEKMSWDQLWDGIGKLAAVTGLLGAAMIPLALIAPGALIGGLALIAMAAGLVAIVGAMKLFQDISWDSLWIGVGKIALVVVSLGLAALIAAPGLILLGVAALAIGVGLMAAGVGMGLLGAGLAVLAASGTAAFAVLFAGLQTFLALLPTMGVQFVNAVDVFLAALADKMPSIVDSGVKIASEIQRGIRENLPAIAETALALLETLAEVLMAATPTLVEAALDVLLSFLDGLTERIPEFADAGADLIIALISGMSGNYDDIALAAGEAILKLLEAINGAVTLYSEQITAEGRSIATNLIKGIVLGLIPQPIKDAFNALTTQVVNFFKNLLGINSPSTVFAGFGGDIVMGLVNGLINFIGNIGGAIGQIASFLFNGMMNVLGMIGSALGGLGGLLMGIFSGAFNSVVSFLGGAVSQIGSAIGRIPGLIGGIIGSVKSKAGEIGGSIIDGIKSGLGKAAGVVADLTSAAVNGIKNAINNLLNLPFKVSLNIPIPGLKDISFGPKTIIPAFAKGVTGFGGGSALVGELGPEIVTMGRGSNVLTNENLTGFMKAVGKLTKVLSRGGGGDSRGGKILFGVDASFRGDPKSDGAAFAANIAAGLIGGLLKSQPKIDQTMAGTGTSLSQAFMDILGIESPSKVFAAHAGNIGQGLINGLIKSTDAVARAAKAMGEAAILAIEQTISDGAIGLEAIRGRVEGLIEGAKRLKEIANEPGVAEHHKVALEAEAKELEAKAKLEEDDIKRREKALALENEYANRKAEYDKADLDRKLEMRKEDAVTAAKRAAESREEAIALQKEADIVARWRPAEGTELAKFAQEALAASQKFAQEAEQAAKEAYELSAQVKQGELDAINAQLQSVSSDDVANAQRLFEEYARVQAEAQAAVQKDLPPNQVTLNQYNTSPEAIPPSEAYRNGKSLINTAERKLVPN